MSALVEDMDHDEEDAFDSSSQASSTQTSILTWINWFTSLPGHDYFCEVSDDYAQDDFNLTGIQPLVPFFREALEMVLDVEPDDESAKIPDVSIVETSAELLYGMIHQRYILTKSGLAAMVDKYEQGHFGGCPRVHCNSTHVVLCGRADIPGVDTVKLFCPNCGDIYLPPSSKYQSVDGAFFGTTFAPLFFQTYPELLSAPFAPIPPQPPTPNSATPPSPSQLATIHASPNPHGGQKAAFARIYTPRIYGFKVSERARSGPRMGWLRARPERWGELEDVDWRGRFVGDTGVGGVLGGDDAERERKSGGLFDDEEEEEDDEEEEEEEEDVKGEGMKVEVKVEDLQRSVKREVSGRR